MNRITNDETTPNRPTSPLRFALIGTVALVAALSNGARADLINDIPDGYAVRSQGSVSVGANARIAGSLGAAGNASLANGAVVTGDLSTGTPYSWHTPSIGGLPSAGSTNVNVAKNGSLALDAGIYDKFTSGSSATLTLTAGEYVFSSFDLAKAGRLLADTSTGDIKIYVTNKLTSASETIYDNIGGGNLTIVTGGSASFGSKSSIEALLYSLGSQSFGSNTLFNGLTWAGGSVSIGQGSEFNFAGPVPAPAGLALLGAAAALTRRRRR